jgi:hypothetical protein
MVNLFYLETNSNFKTSKIKSRFLICKLNSILERYKLKKINSKTNYYKIHKKNKLSNLIEFKEKNKIFILNFFFYKKLKINKSNFKKKILFFNNLKCRFIPKFVSFYKKRYDLIFSDQILIIYKKLKGNIYNGDSRYFLNILKLSISLNKMLNFNRNNHKNIFLKHKINFKKIFYYKKKLVDARFNKNLLKKKIISKSTYDLIFQSHELINEIFSFLRRKKKYFSSKLQLVHNDLNHSNILINKKKIYFLDLESVIYGNKKISYAHLLFKMFRHYFHHNDNKNLFSDSIKKTLFYSVYKAKIFKSIDEIIFYTQLRIISDIIKIIEFRKKNINLYYDYEKKIHNLFEAQLIFNKYET